MHIFIYIYIFTHTYKIFSLTLQNLSLLQLGEAKNFVQRHTVSGRAKILIQVGWDWTLIFLPVSIISPCNQRPPVFAQTLTARYWGECQMPSKAFRLKVFLHFLRGRVPISQPLCIFSLASQYSHSSHPFPDCFPLDAWPASNSNLLPIYLAFPQIVFWRQDPLSSF